mgnify:CR=1 FL=1
MTRGPPAAPPLLPQVTSRGAKVRPLGKGEEAWLVALDEVGSRTQVGGAAGHGASCAARSVVRGPAHCPHAFPVLTPPSAACSAQRAACTCTATTPIPLPIPLGNPPCSAPRLPQAEQLRGHLLYVAASDREALRDPDEFYVTDIIGCSVLDQASGRLVGQVVDVFSGMGTHDTLRVKLRASEADIMNSRIRCAGRGGWGCGWGWGGGQAERCSVVKGG